MPRNKRQLQKRAKIFVQGPPPPPSPIRDIPMRKKFSWEVSPNYNCRQQLLDTPSNQTSSDDPTILLCNVGGWGRPKAVGFWESKLATSPRADAIFTWCWKWQPITILLVYTQLILNIKVAQHFTGASSSEKSHKLEVLSPGFELWDPDPGITKTHISRLKSWSDIFQG